MFGQAEEIRRGRFSHREKALPGAATMI